ncbi:MAG: galactose-1-epimerase [Bacteroidetes bacterium]|jgi:aldose 1-epimerase|nr:galactose-1-epimerase [Bacteroidota bacterium]
MDNTIYKLTNKNGIEVELMAYGARIKSIKTPDKHGKIENVVLGYDTVPAYYKGDPFFGAICGRVANRIENARFVMDGKTYILDANNQNNHLHGGNTGFHVQNWEVDEIELPTADKAYRLSLKSEDGHEGYPGNLDVQIIYALTPQNELAIEYQATTDRLTPVNLTSHGYFNLNGTGNDNVLEHDLQINATHFTPLSSSYVPSGEIAPVDGRGMDFRTFKKIREALESKDEQIEFARGIDHNWVINKEMDQLGLAAILEEQISGRKMEVFTTKPGLQVYIAMHLPGEQKYGGVALEAQHFANSPNIPAFPSVFLKPEDTYRHTTVYKFGLI